MNEHGPSLVKYKYPEIKGKNPNSLGARWEEQFRMAQEYGILDPWSLYFNF